jgi:hypothetical protein
MGFFSKLFGKKNDENIDKRPLKGISSIPDKYVSSNPNGSTFKSNSKNKKPINLGNVRYTIDFLKVFENDRTIKNAEIEFPDSNQNIIINGKSEYFDAYYVNEKGESSDRKYKKVFTTDFGFWINPEDYDDILNIMLQRRQINLENKIKRAAMNAEIKEDYKRTTTYDPIDDDIYKCFIEKQSGMCDEVGSWDNFHKIEEKLAALCLEKGGKYYKSAAKGAKFAIIFSPDYRHASAVEEIRVKGYKVNCFENMVEYFGWQDTFNTDGIKKNIAGIQKFYSI